MVNGFSMAKLMGNSLLCFVIINFLCEFITTQSTTSTIPLLSSSSKSSSSSLSSLTSSTKSSVKIETESTSDETKNAEDKNDLLKDLKDLGPDDLAKLIKAKKEKELDEFKSKIINIRGNREVLDVYRPQQQHQQTKGSQPIVQQQEDDYQSQGDSVSDDDFDDSNDPSGLSTSEKGASGSASSGGGVKKPKFGNLGSLIPFLPNPGSVMTMMVKPIDHPEQMVCDCYNPGKTSNQQTTQQQITQQQLWPPIASNRKVPMMPPMVPIAPILPMQPPINLFPPPSPFSFLGQHFANKPMSSHKKKQLNPLSLLLMGLTGGKRKRSRSRPRPVYNGYPPYQQQQQPITSVLPGFEPNEPELIYPAQQIYNVKGNSGSSKGGRKGRKRPKNPYKNLPPPPSSIKGRNKGKGSEKGKWHWTMADDYKDLTQGFNE